MKRLMIVLSALVLSTSVLMAEKEWTNKVPEVGSVGVGLTFNVVSLATQMQTQPNANSHLGPFLFDAADGLFTTPASMYILSQDPVASIRIKYRMTEHWNIRASIGFNGSHLDYSEYVRDDLAFALDPNSENKAVDHIKADLNSSNFAVGAEFTAGPRNLKFVAGVNLLYAFAGGKMNFSYGNEITAANQTPTTVIGEDPVGTKYNDFPGGMGIAWGRPLERKNAGFTHGIGIQADLGIEWFFVQNLSLGAVATFTPIMFMKQCQTYTTYEGFSVKTGQVEQYNSLVSPGSWACLYGIRNLGLQLSLNYYF